MLTPRWRSLLSLKSNLILELSSSNATAAKAVASTASITRFAPFHSTCVLSEKLKKNFASGGKTSESQRSSKNSSIRFTCTVKEKGRTGAKKALNNLLFHSGINDPLQNEWHFGANPLIRERHMKKKPPPGRGKKPRDKKTKRWHREGNTDDDFGNDANTSRFENKWREKWTSHQSQKAGFEWREGWNWTTQSQRNSRSWSDEFCDEPLIVGSQSERSVLGLPLAGPLNLGDVKNAFRTAALKWHPDKHHGTSQAAAQEKFKLCVDAYKSLCSALS